MRSLRKLLPTPWIYFNVNGDIFIDVDYNGVGDRIQTSAIPEAFYRWYGKKLVDINQCWVFDYNPYVQRREDYKLDIKIKFSGEGFANLYCDEQDWINPDVKGLDRGISNDHPEYSNGKLFLHNFFPSKQEHHISSSRNSWIFQKLGINPHQKPELDIPRGPRLYKYEDPSKVIKDQIVVHVGPSKSTDQFIPDHVLDAIKKRYCSYKIIQIGHTQDNPTPFNDKRGLPIWDSVKIIAESAIFIGINSGPMNIANCYPHLNKKLIMNMNDDWSKNSFERFEPLNGRLHPSFGWVDFGWQYYNTTERDIGRLYSYRRI